MQEAICRDTIKNQARRAVDAGISSTECPYLRGTSAAKQWIVDYWLYELELANQEGA